MNHPTDRRPATSEQTEDFIEENGGETIEEEMEEEAEEATHSSQPKDVSSN